jgi:hypothetical protein
MTHSHCFITGGRLHPVVQLGRSHFSNEAESGSLALRLAGSPSPGFVRRITPPPAGSATYGI